MAVLRLRYFSSFVFKVSISLSMLERTLAMAVCSSFEDGWIIRVLANVSELIESKVEPVDVLDQESSIKIR